MQHPCIHGIKHAHFVSDCTIGKGNAGWKHSLAGICPWHFKNCRYYKPNPKYKE